MTGSGRAIGGGYLDDKTDCKNLVEKTVLNSPDPVVLAKLKEKDILKLVLRRPGGKKIVVAEWKGAVAGSITFARLAQLIRCLEDNHKFVAEIMNVRSGRCEVLVKPADIK